jgi:hypothetical protein
MLVERTIHELIKNKDVELLTHSDLVVGYITKQLNDNLKGELSKTQ